MLFSIKLETVFRFEIIVFWDSKSSFSFLDWTKSNIVLIPLTTKSLILSLSDNILALGFGFELGFIKLVSSFSWTFS